MTRFLRQPVVQFVVLGALLGALLHWLSDDVVSPEETTIRLTADDIGQLRAEWLARWNRPPTEEEFSGLIDAAVRQQVLYREAVGLGLDRDDVVIQRVMVRKLESIANNLIELSLAPTDQDLEQYYRENIDDYQPPSLISFRHVFIDPDQRGQAVVADAERIVTELQALGDEAATDQFGDRFMLPAAFEAERPARVAGLFGPQFADSVFSLPTGQWQGPVRSGYGLHAVLVDSLTEFPLTPLAEVRVQVLQGWVDENRQAITEEYYAELLARYDVIIAGQAEGEVADIGVLPGS